uniref:Ymf77 n=1 Tax=Ichthyophthirius multifiliis TaxID=5932 RepID=G1FLD4_ICHMU|nr:Ymf77 [Ichthyophthirius multifiliis]AEL89276.1 Ymf77 [Ichthyophthirius multifiliis]
MKLLSLNINNNIFYLIEIFIYNNNNLLYKIDLSELINNNIKKWKKYNIKEELNFKKKKSYNIYIYNLLNIMFKKISLIIILKKLKIIIFILYDIFYYLYLNIIKIERIKYKVNFVIYKKINIFIKFFYLILFNIKSNINKYLIIFFKKNYEKIINIKYKKSTNFLFKFYFFINYFKILTINYKIIINYYCNNFLLQINIFKSKVYSFKENYILELILDFLYELLYNIFIIFISKILYIFNPLFKFHIFKKFIKYNFYYIIIFFYNNSIIFLYNIKLYIKIIKFKTSIPLIFFIDRFEFYRLMHFKNYKKKNIEKFHMINYRENYKKYKKINFFIKININTNINIKNFYIIIYEDFNNFKKLIKNFINYFNYLKNMYKCINFKIYKYNYKCKINLELLTNYSLFKNFKMKFKKTIYNIDLIFIKIIDYNTYTYSFILQNIIIIKNISYNFIYNIKYISFFGKFKNYKYITKKMFKNIDEKYIYIWNIITLIIFKTSLPFLFFLKFIWLILLQPIFFILLLWHEFILTIRWLIKKNRKSYYLYKLIKYNLYKKIIKYSTLKYKKYNRIYNIEDFFKNIFTFLYWKLFFKTKTKIKVYLYLPIKRAIMYPIWIIHRHTVYLVFITSYIYPNEIIFANQLILSYIDINNFIISNSLLWIIHFFFFYEKILNTFIIFIGLLYILNWSYKISPLLYVNNFVFGYGLTPLFIELNRMYYLKIFYITLFSKSFLFKIIYFNLPFIENYIRIFDLYKFSICIIIGLFIFKSWKWEAFFHPIKYPTLSRWYLIRFFIYMLLLEYFRFEIIFNLNYIWEFLWIYFNIEYNIIFIYEILSTKFPINILYFFFCKHFLLIEDFTIFYYLLLLKNFNVTIVGYILDTLIFIFLFKAIYLHHKYIYFREFKWTLLPLAWYKWKFKWYLFIYFFILYWYLVESMHFHLFIIYMLMKYSYFIWLYFEVTNHIYPYRTKAWYHKFITEFWPSLIHSFHKAMEVIERTQFCFLIMKLRYQDSMDNQKKEFIISLKEKIELVRSHENLQSSIYLFMINQYKRLYYFKLYSRFYELMTRMENMLKEFSIISYINWFNDWKLNKKNIKIYTWKLDWWDKPSFFFLKRSIFMKFTWHQYKNNFIQLKRFSFRYTFYQIKFYFLIKIELHYLYIYSIWLKLRYKIKINHLYSKKFWYKFNITYRKDKRIFLKNLYIKKKTYKKTLTEYNYFILLKQDMIKQYWNELDEWGNDIELQWAFNIEDKYRKFGFKLFKNPEIVSRIEEPWFKYPKKSSRLNWYFNKDQLNTNNKYNWYYSCNFIPIQVGTYMTREKFIKYINKNKHRLAKVPQIKKYKHLTENDFADYLYDLKYLPENIKDKKNNTNIKFNEFKSNNIYLKLKKSINNKNK